MTDAWPFRVDHVAVIVRSIDAALGYYRDGLGLAVLSDERLASAGVRLAALDGGGVRLQLVEPLAPGPFQTHLDEHGEGLHHLCFAVSRIEDAVARLQPGAEAPVVAAANRRTLFLPEAPNGVRTELIEYVGKPQ